MYTSKPQKPSLLQDILWLIAAALIVGGGVTLYVALEVFRPEVAAEEPARTIATVETTALSRATQPVPITGEGFIQPRREVALASQSGGRIVELHPSIASRGTFTEGEVLLRLDDRSARASLARAEADIAATEARLALNATQLERIETLRARGVATQEQLDQSLSTRTELRASLQSLTAARDSAAVALDMLVVRAPFDGAVLAQHANVGSVVGSGQAVAELFTASDLEVTVPILEAEAALIPGLFSGGAAPATVRARFAGTEVTWTARVSRSDPALDSASRTVGVTVTLDSPTGRGDDVLASGTPPALINKYAEVTIAGARLSDAFALPSTAVRDGNTVWLTDGATLEIRPVELIHVDENTSYVRISGSRSGLSLITSQLARPVDGMPVDALQSDTLAQLAE